MGSRTLNAGATVRLPGSVGRRIRLHAPASALPWSVHGSGKPTDLPGLRVTVDRVLYQMGAVTPSDRPHCFVYFITIHNDSDRVVTVKGRKWVVTSERGEITAVEGDGVVGQHPRISPGEKFAYNSFHLLDTASAVAEGSYLALDAEGRRVIARIPAFRMVVPETT